MAPPLNKILLVEDDADIRAVAQMALETVGALTVKACASGPEALACAPDFAPDLIVLDVMMPGMDGPTTLSQLRTLPRTAETPVAFLTARSMPDDMERLARLGAVEIIAKPFDPMTLADELRRIWETLHD